MVSITSRVIDNESSRQSLEASATKAFEEKTHTFMESRPWKESYHYWSCRAGPHRSKIAHALGAEVTMLSHSVEKQEEGKRMGVDNFYSTSDPSNFKKLKGYFDLMINTVSIVLDSNKYMKLLALDGTLVLVDFQRAQYQLVPSH